MNHNKHHPLPSLLCLDPMMASSSTDAGNWMATAQEGHAFGMTNGMSSMDAIQLTALQQCLLSSSVRQDVSAAALQQQITPLLLQQLLLSASSHPKSMLCHHSPDSPLAARTVLEAPAASLLPSHETPPLLLPKGNHFSKAAPHVGVSTKQQARQDQDHPSSASAASSPRPCDKKYTGALGQVRCQAVTTRRKECAFVVARPGATHCQLHSCSNKSSTASITPKRPRRKGDIPVTHGVLLSQLASSQWKGRQVRVHAGPFAGRTARVRTWGNGWVTIALNDVLPVRTNKDHHRRPLLHNRRAYDLSVVAEVGTNQDQEEQQEGDLHSTKRRRLERNDSSSILVPPSIQKDSPLKSVDSPKGVIMHLPMPPSLFSHQDPIKKNNTHTPKSVSDSSQSGSSVDTSLPSDDVGPGCLEANNPEDEVHRPVHQDPMVVASSPPSSLQKTLVPVVSPEPSEDLLSSADAAAATVVPLPTLPTSNKQNMGKFEMLCMISSLAFVPGQEDDEKKK